MTPEEKLALMGQVVTVRKIYKRCYDGRQRDWSEDDMPESRAGWIVGFRTINSGFMQTEFEYDDPYPHGREFQYYVPGEYQQAAQVCFWYNQTPIYVPLDGFEIGGKPRYYAYSNEHLESES